MATGGRRRGVEMDEGIESDGSIDRVELSVEDETGSDEAAADPETGPVCLLGRRERSERRPDRDR